MHYKLKYDLYSAFCSKVLNLQYLVTETLHNWSQTRNLVEETPLSFFWKETFWDFLLLLRLHSCLTEFKSPAHNRCRI